MSNVERISEDTATMNEQKEVLKTQVFSTLHMIHHQAARLRIGPVGTKQKKTAGGSGAETRNAVWFTYRISTP
jgi:hypothetical protein